VLGRFAAAAALALAACGRQTAADFRAEPVTRGPLAEVVSATGGVEAIVTVNVGSQVSGTLAKVLADFNSQVKKGQLLAQIDPRPFQASLAKTDAGVAAAEADVERTMVTLADAVRIEKRQRELLARKLVSQAEVDTAQANQESAGAAVSAARARVKQARADRMQSALNLEFTRILSPIDGVVISRNVDVGQTVAAAFQAPTLFTLANDLTKMRVLANIDEADVGKVREGQEARFTVDSYPGETFLGTIKQVRQAPSTIQNVVTYAAEIAAPNPERKLRQGMTAAVQVITARRTDTLRVPNAALRWKPAGAEAGRERREGAPGGGARAAEKGRQPKGRHEVRDKRVDVAGDPKERKLRARSSRIYKLVAGKPTGVSIRVGLSDGHHTEVLDGLSEGEEVIVGSSGSGPPSTGPQRGPRRGLF